MKNGDGVGLGMEAPLSLPYRVTDALPIHPSSRSGVSALSHGYVSDYLNELSDGDNWLTA